MEGLLDVKGNFCEGSSVVARTLGSNRLTLGLEPFFGSGSDQTNRARSLISTARRGHRRVPLSTCARYRRRNCRSSTPGSSSRWLPPAVPDCGSSERQFCPPVRNTSTCETPLLSFPQKVDLVRRRHYRFKGKRATRQKQLSPQVVRKGRCKISHSILGRVKQSIAGSLQSRSKLSSTGQPQKVGSVEEVADRIQR